MSSREQFEAWYLENPGHTEDDHEALFERDPDSDEEYYRLGVRMSHQAWQAATSAMEAKCAALAAELKQSQIDAGCYKHGMEASNARLVQVGADHAGRKEFIISDCQVAHIEPETFYEEEVTRYVSADGYEPETPATDAFLAEVRAQGADAVADQHRRKYEELKPINVFFANEHMGAQEVAEFVAVQLRQDANTAELVAAGIITKVGE